jgi:carbamate kinase
MRVVVALGGNALLKRGEPMTADVQRGNVKVAAQALAPVARDHQLVLSHGNGPQVGLLALQGAAYEEVETYPLDVLGAQTEGMIGYMIEQELGNLLPFEVPFATILTMIEVDPDDPAFENPTKFVGPVYDKEEAFSLAEEKGWSIKQDGDMWRRVVPSPLPKRIFEMRPVKWLLEKGTIVICAGGGGIPVMYEKGADRVLVGVEAVIDKDRATELLAREQICTSWPPTSTAYTSTGVSRRPERSSVPPLKNLRRTSLPPVRWVPRSEPPAPSCARPANEPPSGRWPISRPLSPAKRAQS